jgi:glycosyltransferase involved in cell wall biosynthesis
LRARGIEVVCVWRQPGLDLALARRLAALFRSWRIDLIHAHQCTPWFYGALSRLFYRAPRLLLEEHGRFFPEVDNWKRRWVNRLIINGRTHRFIAVSADIRTRLNRYEGIPVGAIDVIYNGLPAPERISDTERAVLRAELGLPPDAFVVGTVGRFDPIKNLPMLIDSLAQVRATNPAVQGLLIGDGPVRPEVEAKIAALKAGAFIHLTGFRSDARRVVQCLDLFVLASFSEGTSMALLEAISCNIPVAVTAVGGNPEVVEAGVTGWVVPSGGVEALSQAIREAASGTGRARQLAEAGRQRFETYFTFDGMIAKYREEYRRLLAG